MAVDLTYITTPDGLAGASASVIAGAGAGNMRVTGLSGMVLGFVGQYLYVEKSANAANNGLFSIASFVNATTVDVVNAGAVIPDAGSLVWVKLSGISNKWIVAPSNDDAKDSPNLQLVLSAAPLITVVSAVPAEIDLATGTFYCRTQLDSADLRATIKPQDAPVTIIAGTKAGGPMDYMSVAKAKIFCQNGLPDLLRLYGVIGGIGTDVTINNIDFRSNPSSNSTVGLLCRPVDGTAAGPCPWDNFCVRCFVSANGIVNQYRTGVVAAISTPDGSHKQTVTSVAALFEPGDIARSFTNYDSADDTNNGRFVITDYVDANNVKILNATGVANAFPNNRWVIFNTSTHSDPGTISTQLINLFVNECTFTGDFGDPVGAYNGQVVSNVHCPIMYCEHVGSTVMEGTATPVVTKNNPNGPGNIGWETRSLFRPDTGKYYWGQFQSLPITGSWSVTNCTFTKCGAALQSNGVVSSSHGQSWLLHPGNATEVIYDIRNNEAIDCGLAGLHATTLIILVTVQGGTITVDGNEILFTENGRYLSNIANNGLSGLLVTTTQAWGEFVVDPTKTFFWGDDGTSSPVPTESKFLADPGRQTWAVTNNHIDMGPAALTNQVQSLYGMAVISETTLVSDPATVSSGILVARNYIAGNVANLFQARGLSNIQILKNTMLGRTDRPALMLYFVGDTLVEDNIFLVKSNPQMQINPSSRDCTVRDTLKQFPKVTNLGKANHLVGCVESTDVAADISDPWFS